MRYSLLITEENEMKNFD